MMMPFLSDKVICFDLDDTLFKEIDFVKSAFGEIATSVGHPELVNRMMSWFIKGENVFLKLNQCLDERKPLSYYLNIYRNHTPCISLSESVKQTMDELSLMGVTLGLITDGRSICQRNKIKALKLNQWIEEQNIIISEEFGSEKTNEQNFLFFHKLYPEASFMYVGDNPHKDFVIPNKLNWQTIMVKDDGRNIHHQNKEPKEFNPKIVINSVTELIDYIK